MWSNDDFGAVNAFLHEMRELLRTCPERLPEFAEVLRQDCERAKEAFARISDAMAGT